MVGQEEGGGTRWGRYRKVAGVVGLYLNIYFRGVVKKYREKCYIMI